MGICTNPGIGAIAPRLHDEVTGRGHHAAELARLDTGALAIRLRDP
jgi:hypothetical protein